MRAGEAHLQRFDLGLGQAVGGRALGADKTIERKGLLAGGEVGRQPVLDPVELVAGGRDLPRCQRRVLLGDGLADVRVRLDEGLRVPGVLERGARQVEAGVADEIAVVFVGHARGRDHRVPAAVRAAAVIGKVGLAAVVGDQDRLGDRGERHVGGVAVITPRLGIEAEGDPGGKAERRVGRVGARMAAVGGEHREAARERRDAARGERSGNVADCRPDVAVGPAVALMQEAPVPFDRQPHLETDGVMLAVAPGAVVDPGAEDAVRRQALSRRLQGRGFDDEARNGELLRRSGRAGLVGARRSARQGDRKTGERDGQRLRRERPDDQGRHGVTSGWAVNANENHVGLGRVEVEVADKNQVVSSDHAPSSDCGRVKVVATRSHRLRPDGARKCLRRTTS